MEKESGLFLRQPSSSSSSSSSSSGSSSGDNSNNNNRNKSDIQTCRKTPECQTCCEQRVATLQVAAAAAADDDDDDVVHEEKRSIQQAKRGLKETSVLVEKMDDQWLEMAAC